MNATRPPIALTGASLRSLALTGATGFVGQALLDAAAAAGVPVRALTRRAQPPRPGVTWIEGALDTPDALARLAEGADAFVHVAGAVNAPDRAGFIAANVTGTEAALRAAVDVPRFVHVSSLAAREPALSTYGWSKAEGEAMVRALRPDAAIVRPPGVYGPRDTEMLDLFRMAQRGLMLLPPGGRASLIHADDLARLLLLLADPATPLPAHALEPDDARAGGWTHQELADAIGTAVGRSRLLRLSAPRPLLHLAARGDRLVRGPKAKLTPDRASYLAHPDWVSTPILRPDPALWLPVIPTDSGLAATAAWYRQAGWLA